MTSVKLVHFTSKAYNNGEHPVMIRLIKERKVKYISLGYSCKKSAWDKKNNEPNKKFPNYQKAKILFNKRINKINQIILDFDTEELDYTLDDVIRKYRSKTKKITVLQYLDKEIDRLIKLDKIGTANTRKDLKRVLVKFLEGKDVTFPEVNHNFLKALEEDFLLRGAKETTISVYMRTLKAVYNKAIEEDYCKREHYPFDKYKTSKLNTKTEKRALTKIQLDKIIKLQDSKDSPLSDNIKLLDAYYLFLFSYYNRGMNLIDIAKLKWSNIEGDRLKYIRSKNGKNFNMELLNQAKKILEYYRTRYTDKSDYVFPILNERHKTATSINNRIKKVTKEINDNLREIGALTNISGNITFYVARHSWASIMYRAGIPISIISESLGHDDEKTTRIYLAELGNKALDDANRKVLSDSSSIDSVMKTL